MYFSYSYYGLAAGGSNTKIQSGRQTLWPSSLISWLYLPLREWGHHIDRTFYPQVRVKMFWMQRKRWKADGRSQSPMRKEKRLQLCLRRHCVFVPKRRISLADFSADAILTAVNDNSLPGNECSIVTC
jgi:hypothetical protein